MLFLNLSLWEGFSQEAGMDTIKIRFADDIEELGTKLERTVEDMFRVLNPVFNLTERSWKPQMDMNETPGQIIIVAEAAGVNQEDLEVEISSGRCGFVRRATPVAGRHMPACQSLRKIRTRSFCYG
jgi:HSP20 family protein